MQVIKSKVIIVDDINQNDILKKIEAAGRTCYKSEAKITDNSAENFIKQIIRNGHDSVLEHEKLTVRIICDRGVSHELVRHRIGSFSQESTRYCDYNKGVMEFIDIKPYFRSPESVKIWEDLLQEIENKYKLLRSLGETPQIARSILPNSLKTEIVITFNIRQWRHFFKLRTSKAAHPQMREVAIETLNLMKVKFPVLFEDIQVEKT
jgi:thymidylate synthase (FAD)